MNFLSNFLGWLFITPADEGATTTSGNPTNFNAGPWLLIVGLLFLAGAYYWVEGRSKIPFIKSHRVWRYIVLDRLTQQVNWWAGVGLLIIGTRVALFYTLFAWRFWFLTWMIWGLCIAGYWLRYFIVHHNGLMVQHSKEQEKLKFLPSKSRR